MHLFVKVGGALGVVRGPKENGHRPSVDMLFRTAAAIHGPRVIGVVLSGELDCGTAGVISIRARGGVAIAQDPGEAFAPSMPESAAKVGKADHIASLADMPGLILRLLEETVEVAPPSSFSQMLATQRPGLNPKPFPLVCPTCQGALSELDFGSYQSFSCHAGHVFSLQSIVLEQAESLERALWSAVRALEESAALSDRLAQRSHGPMERRFEEKKREQLQQAAVIRELLLHGKRLTQEDGAQPWTESNEKPEASERRPD